ncbi:MAG: cytochrome c oxidase assembly protein [Solirubrobacterales bacterium]
MSAAAPALLAACLYGVAWVRVRRWPAWRSAAFGAGLMTLAIALGPELDGPAGDRLSAHMAQHLLLATVAPPLLIAGAPVELALRAARGGSRRRLARAVSGAGRILVASPLLGVLAFAIVTVVVHLPAVYDAALRHPWVYALEHALFFWAGILLWLPLLGWLAGGHGPSPLAKLLAIAAATVPMALVAIWLMSAPTVVYAPYGSAHAAAALADQRAAGTIMLGGGNLVMGAVAVAVVWGALTRQERRQRDRELYADRGRAA